MDSVEPDTTRHTFRQRGSVVLGAVCMLACVGMFLGSLSQTNLAFAGSMALATCWSFVLLVRPSLQLSVAGVHINNPLRRTTIPWRLVEDCLTRWNLQVYAGEQAVTAWAISSSIERPKSAGPYAGRLFGPGLRADVASSVPRAASAPAVAQLIREGRAEWDDEVAAGLMVDDGRAQVVRQWDWLDAVLLVGPICDGRHRSRRQRRLSPGRL